MAQFDVSQETEASARVRNTLRGRLRELDGVKSVESPEIVKQGGATGELTVEVEADEEELSEDALESFLESQSFFYNGDKYTLDVSRTSLLDGLKFRVNIVLSNSH